ncbi:MAG: hypothetical protein ABL886_04585, partial [Rhodoglobus sp.]
AAAACKTDGSSEDTPVSGHYSCVVEHESSSPDGCIISWTIRPQPELEVAEHEGEIDIGTGLVINNDVVLHGTLDDDGVVHATHSGPPIEYDLIAVANPASLRDVRVSFTSDAPPCTHTYAGVCARSTPDF